ncbi:hypothetical protein ACB087_01975 [Vibrio sp. VNB-15]
MAKGIGYREFDERIYAMWKAGNVTQTFIAEKLKIHRNTVRNAIQREQAKEQALKIGGYDVE